MTVDELEIHECRFQGSGIRIEKSRNYFHDGSTWQLVVTREATEEDLANNHYLEVVGEGIWSIVVEISNCPYCGKELRNDKAKDIRFVLFDSTGFSVKIL